MTVHEKLPPGRKGLKTYMERTRNQPVQCFFFLLLMFFASLFGIDRGLCQPPPTEDLGPRIEIGGVTFRTREVEAKPQPLKILEVHIEVLNRSRKFAAPLHSVKVVLVPKQVLASGGNPAEDFDPVLHEAAITVDLPARAGREVIIGFSLPPQKLESITFEAQINPPEGDKKTVTWNGE
jgi:hypothetical protein